MSLEAETHVGDGSGRANSVNDELLPERAALRWASGEALASAPHMRPRRFSYVNPELIDILSKRYRDLSNARVMATLGISINTWNKLKAGEPVRTSLALRLVERMFGPERADRLAP